MESYNQFRNRHHVHKHEKIVQQSADVKITTTYIKKTFPIRWSTCIWILILLTVTLSGVIFLYHHHYHYHSQHDSEFQKNHKLQSPSKKLIPPNPEVTQPPSQSEIHTFNKAAVCTDGVPCSQIGKNVLKQGGSAMDGAIAALFCNGIVNSHSMGLGGGFFLVSYNHRTKTAESLIAREKAPIGADQNMFTDKTGIGYWDNNSNPSRTGGLAIGVPGELRGYWEAWKKHGRLDWPELIAPSIRLCRIGYNMTKHQYDMLNFRKTAIQNDPNLRETFIDSETNTFKKIGSLIYPVKICETLERIASQGGDILYNGALTHVFVKDIQNVGGIITQQDLYNYSPEWTEPVSVKLHGGETVYSVPPPGSGSLLTFILSVLDGYNITKPDNGSIEKDILTIHRIIESFKYAFARRTELGDPKFINITELMNQLSSPKYAEEIRKNISDFHTFQDPKHYGAVYFNNDDHGTAHVSVISPEGDAVSVTSTVNLYFGAGVTSASTGIILNSVMDDFSIPGELNYFDLPSTPNNYIAPNKRPLSSAAPAIVVNADGTVRLAIGAGGGTKIPTAVVWVIIRHLWYNEDIKQAIDASRFHHQLMPMEISYEYGILQQIIEALEEIGHKTRRYRDRGSIISAVSKENGKIQANVDFRKGGEVDGIN